MVELAHVMAVVFGVVIIYLFLTRNRGGVRDIGAATGRELFKHTTIIMDGLTYRPESAHKTNEPGMYKVTMREIENDGRLGDSVPFLININNFNGRMGLSLVSGELVWEEDLGSIIEMVDPVMKKMRDDELLAFFEQLEYKEVANQLKDAERGQRELRSTVTGARKKMLEYVNLLQKQHKKIATLETTCNRLKAMVDAYGQAPDVINQLATANAELRRLSSENAELRTKATVEAEAVQKIMRGPGEGGGQDVTVVK